MNDRHHRYEKLCKMQTNAKCKHNCTTLQHTKKKNLLVSEIAAEVSNLMTVFCVHVLIKPYRFYYFVSVYSLCKGEEDKRLHGLIIIMY